MAEGGQGAEPLDFDAEFLAELADQGGHGGFVRLDFSAGEFPFQREVLVRGTLRDEHAAGAVNNDGGDDGNGFGFGHGGRNVARPPGAVECGTRELSAVVLRLCAGSPAR